MDNNTQAARRALAVLLVSVSLATAACSAAPEAEPSKRVPVVQEVPEGAYRAEFPCAPVREEFPTRVAGADLAAIYFRCVTATEEVGVGHVDYPRGTKITLAGAAEGSAEGLDGKVVSKTDTTFMGHPAMDVVVDAPDGTVYERLVARGTRLYTVIGTSTAGKPASYDRLVETLFLH